MLNNLPIGNFATNSSSEISLTLEVGEVISSSFSLTQLPKYSFKTSNGSFFNFGNICDGRTYGNYLVSHNFEDIPNAQILKYRSPLRNGGRIYDKRYDEKDLKFEFVIISDTIESLQNEIRELKQAFEKGGEIHKIDNLGTLKLNVELDDMEVDRFRLTGTSVKVSLISMDPFWTGISQNTIINEGNVAGSFDGSIVLTETGIKGFINQIIYFKAVTGAILGATIDINGFPITITQTLVTGDILVINGIESECKLNGTLVDFTGIFQEIEPDELATLNISFSGAGSVDEFDLYTLYSNNQL